MLFSQGFTGKVKRFEFRFAEGGCTKSTGWVGVHAGRWDTRLEKLHVWLKKELPICSNVSLCISTNGVLLMHVETDRETRLRISPRPIVSHSCWLPSYREQAAQSPWMRIAVCPTTRDGPAPMLILTYKTSNRPFSYDNCWMSLVSGSGQD